MLSSSDIDCLNIKPSKQFDIQDPSSNSTSGCEAVVRSVISLGLLPNILNLHQNDDTIKVTSVNDQELAFHPRSCNRNVVKHLQTLIYSKTVPRLFCYFEKMSCNSIYISDSTAIGPLPLVILSPNLEFKTHPDPSGDTSIDNPTKKKLGVLFADNNGRVSFVVYQCFVGLFIIFISMIIRLDIRYVLHLPILS